MRYFSRSELAPTTLKAILEKFNGVKAVKFDGDKMTVSFSYTGTYKGLNDIEAVTNRANVPAALLSHAYVVLAVSPKRGYEADGLRSSLQGVAGVKYVCCATNSFADLYADISSLDIEALAAVAEGASAKAQVKTHETVVITVEGGDIESYVKTLFDQKKTLLLAREGDTITLKTLKKLTDSVLKQQAVPHKVTVKKIDHKG